MALPMRLVLLLVARVVLPACAHQLRGPSDIPDPPAEDPVKHKMQMNTASAKISALKVKSVYAANTAQGAAAQAATQKLKVEEIYIKAIDILPELKAIKKNAQYQAAKATEASKEGGAAVKKMQNAKKSILEKSKLAAVQRVRALLKNSYNDLSGWRHNVLSNPWQKGQVAAAKAAGPYFAMMGKFGANIAAYGLEASNMRSQSASDGANAKAMAAGAQAKRDAGEVIAAAQDDQMATALSTQSQQLAARADILDGQASDMRNVMPQYGGAAHMAAWNAEYAANPDSIPPPPVDPNFAYNSKGL